MKLYLTSILEIFVLFIKWRVVTYKYVLLVRWRVVNEIINLHNILFYFNNILIIIIFTQYFIYTIINLHNN